MFKLNDDCFIFVLVVGRKRLFGVIDGFVFVVWDLGGLMLLLIDLLIVENVLIIVGFGMGLVFEFFLVVVIFMGWGGLFKIVLFILLFKLKFVVVFVVLECIGEGFGLLVEVLWIVFKCLSLFFWLGFFFWYLFFVRFLLLLDILIFFGILLKLKCFLDFFFMFFDFMVGVEERKGILGLLGLIRGVLVIVLGIVKWVV